MLDFITIPLVVAMVTLGIYKLFELFVCKKERMAIIEKIGDKFDASMIENKFSFPFLSQLTDTFGTLKIACLLIGVGLGLLIGYFISLATVGYNPEGIGYQITGVYGACVLLFGGLGLLIAFFIEQNYKKNKKSE